MPRCWQPRFGARASSLCGLLTALALFGCGDDADAGARVREAGVDSGESPSGRRSDASAGVEDAGPPEPTCVLPGCDVLDPDACNAGEGCIVAFPEAAGEPLTTCAQVGEGADGTSCSSEHDCAPGLHCAMQNGAGRCRHYCCEPRSAGGCPSGQFCGLELEDSRGVPTSVFLCEGCNECDVRDLGACERGFGCYLLPELGDCHVCLPAGDRRPGEACEFSTDCGAGAACVRDADRERRCIEYCDLSAPACSGNTECNAPEGTDLPAGTGLCLDPG